MEIKTFNVNVYMILFKYFIISLRQREQDCIMVMQIPI